MVSFQHMRVPSDWIGIPAGDPFHAEHPFPCIGPCNGRYKAGTSTQGFRDFGEVHFQSVTEWQHMCLACAAVPSNVEFWKQRYAARRALLNEERRAKEDEKRRSEEEAAEDRAIDEMLARMEQDLESGIVDSSDGTVEAGTSPPPAAAAPAPPQPAETQSTPETAAATPETAAAPPASFLTHHDERMLLGKPLWTEVKGTIPRVQHDGTLAMPSGCHSSVDLNALRRNYPRLPFIEPRPSTERALSLLAASPDGTWGCRELREQARARFECEAAGIQLALVG